MPREKKNHFVSRGIVQFWARPDGRVYYWERAKPGKGAELRNTKSIHYKDYLYARWGTDGVRDMKAEHNLKLEIDDHAPNLIRNLVEAFPDILPLPQKDRNFLSRLIVRSVLRNPATLNWVKNNWRFKLIGRITAWSRRLSSWRNGDAAVLRLGLEKVIDGDLNFRAATLDISKRSLDISKKKFCFLVAEAAAPNFVLGSQPYLLNPYGPNDDAKICLAIHPRILVAVYDDQSEDEIMELSVEDVRRINGFFAKYSETIAMMDPHDIDNSWYLDFSENPNGERIEIRIRHD